MQDIERQVSARIRAIRVRKGITQEYLAELAGLNRTHLYRIENGLQSITHRTLKSIADALDVRITQLVSGL